MDFEIDCLPHHSFDPSLTMHNWASGNERLASSSSQLALPPHESNYTEGLESMLKEVRYHVWGRKKS